MYMYYVPLYLCVLMTNGAFLLHNLLLIWLLLHVAWIKGTLQKNLISCLERWMKVCNAAHICRPHLLFPIIFLTLYLY